MIPERGSTATASCEKRPIAGSGTACTCPSAHTGTSKLYPCPFRKPVTLALGGSNVSSDVIQLRHGVRPPAQFTWVPPTLTQSRTRGEPLGPQTRDPSFACSTSSVVVPPLP